MRQDIKDFYGRILGSLDEQSNGNIIARDFYGRILGTYDKASDVTKDFYGRIVSSGNTVVSFIWQEANKK